MADERQQEGVEVVAAGPPEVAGDEEQEDRAIFFIGQDGRTQPAEARSDVIQAISGIETQIYRLYYDDQDPEMMNRLGEDEWLPRGERTPPKAEETP